MKNKRKYISFMIGVFSIFTIICSFCYQPATVYANGISIIEEGTLFNEVLSKTGHHTNNSWQSAGSTSKTMGPYDLTTVKYMTTSGGYSNNNRDWNTGSGSMVWYDANHQAITGLVGTNIKVSDFASMYDLTSCTCELYVSGSTRNLWESSSGYGYMYIRGVFSCTIDELLPTTPAFLNGSLPIQYGIENGNLHVSGWATFPDETDTENSYEWYMLVDDGANSTGQAFSDNTTSMEASDFVSKDGEYNIDGLNRKWIKVDSSTAVNQANTDYHYNITTTGDVNRFDLTSASVTGDTLNINNLTATSDSISGCWFKCIAKNSAGKAESAPFQVKVDSVSRFYPYEETIDAEEVSKINWEYGLDANGEIQTLYTRDTELDAIIDDRGVLHVPTTINGIVVRGVGGGTADTPFIPASVGITGIDFPHTVQRINDYAFAGMTKRTGSSILNTTFEVEIPTTIDNVGEKAFYGSKVESVKMNNNNLNAYRAFANCDKLERVVFNGQDLTVGDNVFEHSAVSEIQFNGKTKLGRNAFLDNLALQSLHVPSNVTLGRETFSGCSNLEKLALSCADVPSEAFKGCRLTEVTFDNGVGENQPIPHDWAGNPSAINGAKFNVTSHSTMFEGIQTCSPFGAAGTTDIYYKAALTDDNAAISENGDSRTGILYKIEDANDNNTENKPYFTQNGDVTLVFHNGNPDTIKRKEGESDDDFAARKNNAVTAFDQGLANMDKLINELTGEDGQTGISAEYNRTLFVDCEPLDKSDVTVLPVGGPNNLNPKKKLKVNEFYVFRATSNDTDKAPCLTKEAIETKVAEIKAASVDGNIKQQIIDYLDGQTRLIKADASDLIDEDDKYGAFKAIAVVPYNDGVWIDDFSITVEKYNLFDFAFSKYGSYSEIIKALGKLDTSIQTLKDDIDRYKSLLDTIKQILNDNENVDVPALKDKVQELQDEYDAMSQEDKEGLPGQMLQHEIDSLNMLINVIETEGKTIKDLREELNAKERERARLEAEYNRIQEEFDKFQSQFTDTVIGFTTLVKSATGEDLYYMAFIGDGEDAHQYLYYPAECKRLREDDPMSPIVYVAHIDTERDPNAPDLDGKDPTDTFEFYMTPGECHVIDGQTYNKNLISCIEDAKNVAKKVYDNLGELTAAFDTINKTIKDLATELAKAGYEVDIDGKDSGEAIEEIKKAMKDLLTYYIQLRAKITDDPNAKAEDVLREFENLFAKISDLEDQLKDALGLDPEDDSRLEALLDQIRNLKTELDALRNGETPAPTTSVPTNPPTTSTPTTTSNPTETETATSTPTGTTEPTTTTSLEELKQLVLAVQKRVNSLPTDNNTAAISDINSKLSSLSSKTNGTSGSTASDMSGLQSELSGIKSALGNIKSVSGGGGYTTGSGTTTNGTAKDTNSTTDKSKTTTITKENCKHDYKYVDNKDGKTHKKTCILCGDVVEKEEHVIDETTGKCKFCGYQKASITTPTPSTTPTPTNSITKVDPLTCQHKWTYTVNNDGTHNKKCTVCGSVENHEAHVFDETTGRCECGATKPETTQTKQVNWKVTTTNEVTPTVTGEPAEEVEEEESNTPIVLLAILAIIILGVTGFVVWKFLLKDKFGNKNDDEEDFDDDEDFMTDDDDLQDENQEENKNDDLSFEEDGEDFSDEE